MPKLKIILPFNLFLYLIVILSFLIAFYRSTILKKTSIYLGNEEKIKGTIIDYKKTSEKLSLTLLTTQNNLKEKVIVNFYYPENNDTKENLIYEPNLGDSISVYGKFKKPNRNTIPNTFNYQDYLYHQNIYYIFTAKNILLERENTNYFHNIQDWIYKRTLKLDEKGYITMLIYGKKMLDQDTYSNLQNLGVIHLFAISGLHLNLFTVILEKFLSKLRISSKIRGPIIIIFLTIYAAIINFPASVLRALIMYIFLKIFKSYLNFKKNSPSNYQILLLSLSTLCLINQDILYDIGFLYSGLCSFGLLYYNDNTKNHLLKSLKTTYIATIWSLPITISLQYSYNLLTPLFNLLYVPFISFLFYPVCLLSFLFPFLIPILKILIFILEKMTLYFNLLSLEIILPKMSILFITIYYLNICFLSKYKKKYYHLFNLLLLNIYPLSSNLISSFQVYYLDVNQGDASIIISPYQNEVTMIDTGGINTDKNYYTAKNIIKFLHSINIKKIDNLIISHGDFDHIGNAFYFIDNIKIGKIIFNNNEFNELEVALISRATSKKIAYSKGKDSSLAGKYGTWYFLDTINYDDENDNSLVTYLKYHDYTFLFMGDASKVVESNIMKKYKLEKIDFLKVGHHGSKTSSSKGFINYIKPKYAFISVGRKNKYGHPNKEALENLESSIIYRTDLMGTIELTINKKILIKNYSP